MAEKTNAHRVREFHEAIGEFPPRTPTYPSAELLTLRRRLVEEEYAESMEAIGRLRAALGSSDPAELEAALAESAHELTDLLYVTYGALVWLGIDADAVFAEVHSANMRKTTGPKRADGKQLKPEGWQPADIEGLLAREREAADT